MTVAPHPTRRTLINRLARPTLPELWTFLAVALPVVAALLATLPTVDLAYQLRAGADILAGRGIPATDTWTFTAAGRPWLDQQWGAQAVLSAVFAGAGWTGLAVLRAALVGAISWLILLAIRRRAPGMRQRTAALLTLAAFVVMAPALALRPQLFGMALFALALAVLAGRRERPAWLWIVPALAAVWANMHGSFILAPVLVGFACLEDLHDRLPRAGRTLGFAAATSAATLVTPFGIGAWGYALGLATNREVTARISEWQAPTLSSGPGILFWGSVVLVALAAVVHVRRRGALPWPALLALAAFAALGAATGRGIPWWSMVAAVSVASLVAMGRSAEVKPMPRGRPRRLNSAVAMVLILAGIVLLPCWRPVDRDLGAPSGALSYAPSRHHGRLAGSRDHRGSRLEPAGLGLLA